MFSADLYDVDSCVLYYRYMLSQVPQVLLGNEEFKEHPAPQEQQEPLVLRDLMDLQVNMAPQDSLETPDLLVRCTLFKNANIFVFIVDCRSA